MGLKNRDGTPYKVTGSIRQYDPSNPEHDLFNLWDAEVIEMGGSPIYYYEVFIQSGTVDPVYLEDRGKIWSTHPVQLYGVYEPIRSQNNQTAFGIDSPDEMLFDCNYRAVIQAIGHAPKVGSRINTPHLNENWEIVQVNRGEFKLWGALRMQIVCRRFQESSTTGEGKVTESKQTFTIR